MLNECKGNMYSFVTHTWNAIKGICPHNCTYCYMKSFPQKEIRFDKNELKTNLGENNFIFVGSSCDVFANDVPDEWIEKTLKHCFSFNNRYLYQTKNPKKIWDLRETIPINFLPNKNNVIGTTIETNRNYKEMGNTPSPQERILYLALLKSYGFDTMITIEPIMDFDEEELVGMISVAKPTWVNIGADSKGHKLTEPSKEKIEKLIVRLKQITTVKEKSNLGRLMK